MKTNFIEHAALLPLLSTLIFQPSTASAQGTAFTYQGRLNSSGSPASGLYDFRFRLDADPAGNTILATVLTNGVSVSNGLFTTTIDFGAGFFNGSNYWLEVDVTTNIPSGYTQLNPFQPFTPAPYAVFASTAGNVTGAIALTQLPAAVLTNNETGVTVSGTVSGTFSGDGGGLTNLNAAQLAESGTQNVFIGSAGSSTTIIGFNNVAIGDSAFLHNSGGALDTAVGAGALESNTFGQQNAAYGAAALQNNTSGIENTASGVDALQMNQAGNFNTAYGFQALLDGTSGSANTAVGMGALEWGTVSQPGGPGGTNNIAVGYQAGSNYTGIESSNIVIGNVGVKGENNTIRIGSSQAQTFIAGVINGNGGGLTNLNAAQLAESGTQNVFIGSAGSSTTIIGFNNVAIGDSAFLHNSGGALDTAVGAGALESNTFGQQNAAYGAAALQNNTSGIENTASGVDALQMNQAGNFNTAYGFQPPSGRNQRQRQHGGWHGRARVGDCIATRRPRRHE